MSKLAFTALLNRPDSVLSPHFGKAKWIMIRDEAGHAAFEQNTALNGRGVVDILRTAGCTDVITAEIGQGAFQHLQQAGIRSWLAPEGVPIPHLAEKFSRGELSPLSPKQESSGGCCQRSAHEASVVHGHGGGCCSGAPEERGSHAHHGHGGCCCRQ